MKKFLLPLSLLFFISACSSSDDPEALNNTDNGGTTTDNDGGDDVGWVPTADTAYFYTRDLYTYYSYDHSSVYVTIQIRIKMTDSTDYSVSSYFAKRDLSGNIIWVLDPDLSGSYLCDNKYTLLETSYFEDDTNEWGNSLLLIDADDGSYITRIKFPNDCIINGYEINSFEFDTQWGILRYNDDYYLLYGHPFVSMDEPNLYLIMDGENGDIVEYGRTNADVPDIKTETVDYSADGFVVSHRTELRAINSDETIIVVYIYDIFNGDSPYYNLKLWNGDFYPYDCEVESVGVSGTDIIYTLALASPPEDSWYPAYSKAKVTISLDTKSITQQEGIY